jgi:hypothetical protein
MRCVCCADAVNGGAHARRAGPLRLVDEYMDSGAWWQPPPPIIPRGATVAWAAYGIPGVPCLSQAV